MAYTCHITCCYGKYLSYHLPWWPIPAISPALIAYNCHITCPYGLYLPYAIKLPPHLPPTALPFLGKDPSQLRDCFMVTTSLWSDDSNSVVESL